MGKGHSYPCAEQVRPERSGQIRVQTLLSAAGRGLTISALFGIETARAVAEEIGPDRVGFRVSPGNTLNDIAEVDPQATYSRLVSGSLI